MIPLTLISDPSDLVASVSLAVLAVAFGLLPAELIMPIYLRKRSEFALVLALACLHRSAELLHIVQFSFGMHVTQAVVAALTALTTLWSLARHFLRARHDG